MTRIAALALAGAVLAAPALAQKPTGSVAGTAGSARSRADVGATSESFTGMVIGGEGRLRLGRVTLDVSYREGDLKPDTGSAESRGYVEGAALLSVTAVPGVALRVGPHARAYISTTGTQRWLFWTARLRGERNLIAPVVSGYAELWVAWSGEVNVSEPFSSATGGVAGMIVQFPKSPLWTRLSYGIERARMGDGARLETVETASLVLGFGRR